MIDSPGIAGSEGTDNAARLITAECRQSQACGYIYILDASVSAEEAAQVGQVYNQFANMILFLKSFEMCRSVIFSWQ